MLNNIQPYEPTINGPWETKVPSVNVDLQLYIDKKNQTKQTQKSITNEYIEIYLATLIYLTLTGFIILHRLKCVTTSS